MKFRSDRVVIISLFVLLSLSGAASAAESADKIIKRAVRAMGGEKALKRINSRQSRGTITRLRDEAAGSYQTATMQPDFYALVFDVSGFEIASGFNGKSGWRRDSREGLRTLTGSDIAAFQAEAAYRNLGLLNYKKQKSKITYAGQMTLKEKPAHAVLLTTNRGVKIKLYFDAASGLLVREEIGEGARIFEYSDYRPVAGIVEPFGVTLQEAGETYSIKIEEFLHNQSIARSVFDYPKISNEPLPDFASLLARVKDHQKELDQLLEKYGYKETVSSREINKQGVFTEKENETYEISFFRGFRIRRLVAKGGKPLSESDQAKEDRRIEKLVKDLEAGKDVDDPFKNRRLNIGDLLRACRFVNPRRERFRQRDVIVSDFEPDQSFKPSTTYEGFWHKVTGSIWIDAADLQVARVEFTLLKAFNVGGGLFFSMRPGARFVIEQARFAEEVWLPTYTEVSFSARAMLFAGLGINRTVRYEDYRRFNVKAEEQIKPPDEKPNKP
jgi:hypothetical protein